MTGPEKASNIDKVDGRTEDQKAADLRRKAVERVMLKRQAVLKAGGDISGTPGLAADLESRLRRVDRRLRP